MFDGEKEEKEDDDEDDDAVDPVEDAFRVRRMLLMLVLVLVLVPVPNWVLVLLYAQRTLPASSVAVPGRQQAHGPVTGSGARGRE
ncbi:MAG: hypothetical protein M1826_002285 [Phylliscum demangeonii]|nr:MAG: hypothetical protein M1826_002285 [Phylliscum demangeonii]